VGRYLKGWGFTPPKPARRVWAQNPEQVRQWLEKEYLDIRRQAKRDKAQIYWGDKMGRRSNHAVGRACGLKGQKPVVPATGQRFGCHRLSAITDQGRLNFMVFKERFTDPVFLEFLRRLHRQSDGRVYLIIDCHPVRRSPEVKTWVKENEERLRFFFFPVTARRSTRMNYSIKIKSNALGGQRPENQTGLMGKVRSHLRSRPGKPHRAAPYFQGNPSGRQHKG